MPMKTRMLIVLAAALLPGCGERVASPVSEAVPPVISTTAVKREREFVSGTAQPAAAGEPARSAPDYKDSSATLDRSR